MTSTTTTIRLTDEIRKRLAAAAAASGVSALAAGVEAFTARIEQIEEDEAFHRVAETRWAMLLAGGPTVPWDDAQRWLEQRAASTDA